MKKKIKKLKSVKMKKTGKNVSPAKIKVIGIGGAGGNAISRMVKNFPKGIDFVAINTDIQDLNHTKAKKKIFIGRNITKGLGTGMKPELGKKAAEDAKEEISQALKGADIIFITAGFGGGTGTGASPVVAEIARELGILTIAVITKPFSFEGAERSRLAEEGIANLGEKVDAVITIPNDRIFNLIDKETSLPKAFEEIDEVLKNAIEGISEIIMTSGVINVDFADVKTILENTGLAVIGVGKAAGKDRAINSVNLACNSPLLEIPIDGAKAALFSIASNRDLKMEEVNEIAQVISSNLDSNAKIIFGTYHSSNLKKGELKTIVIATGFIDQLTKPLRVQTDLFIRSVEKEKEQPTLIEEKMKEKLQPLDLGKPKDKKSVEKKAKTSPPDEDIWEVPAFLRKKRK